MVWQAVMPEDAATVVLVREGKSGLEVYMTRRQDRLKFLGGFHVFPGGKVDADDFSPRALDRSRSLSPAEAAARLPNVHDPKRAVGFFVAGVRELFEEAGVLLAESDSGVFLDNPSPELTSRLAALRKTMQKRKLDFLDALLAENLYCSLDKLLWFAHWITPATSPRRFNTYFFLAKKPRGQEPSPFAAEIREAVWVRPEEALKKWRSGEWRMIPPTISSLDTLSRYNSWSKIEIDFIAPPDHHRRIIWTG